jgi:hypothetical protein
MNTSLNDAQLPPTLPEQAMSRRRLPPRPASTARRDRRPGCRRTRTRSGMSGNLSPDW